MFNSTSLRSSRRTFAAHACIVNQNPRPEPARDPTFKYSDATEHIGSTRAGLVWSYSNGQA
jgi:hypothetical protein